MVKSNYLIINKKAQEFSSVKYSGKAAVFTDREGTPLDYGVLIMDGSIYALLVCSEFRLAVLVIDRQGERSVEDIFWLSDADFEGLTVKIPARWDEVLTILFGPDYMTPPPESERVAKHLDV